ncbi:MAG: Gldg family protein [Gemmatimonadota bacterium]
MSGRNVFAVAAREFRGYFDQATAYILLVVFLAANFFFFFRTVFVTGEASLRPMFALMPWLLLFLVPAMTMRSIAEDRARGTIELLLAQPIREVEYVLGKFVGMLGFLGVALLGTLAAWFALDVGGDPRVGPAFAQYVGTFLLGGALVSIGLWASATTRNQITAFIIATSTAFVLMAFSLPVVLQGLPPIAAAAAQRLGLLAHHSNITRGVLDLRDVVYFLTVTLAFLSLAYLLLQRGRRNPSGASFRKLQLGVVGILAICVVVNLLGRHIRGRWDVTPGGAYTLSEPTRELLNGLEDVVSIRFFASRDLPAQAEAVKRDADDLLADYAAAGGDQVVVRRTEPVAGTDEGTEAEGLGIAPIEFQVLGEDEFQSRQGYLGIALQYADGLETVPYIRGSENLEYELTSAILSMTQPTAPGVGLVGGFGGPGHDTDLAGFVTQIGESYSVATVDLAADSAAIPDSIDVMVVAGPARPLTPAAGAELRRFVGAGGNLMLLMQTYAISESQMFADTLSHPELDALLAPYGVRVAEGAAYDMRSNFPVTQQSESGLPVQRPYPLWPVSLPVSAHPVVSGLAGVALGWASPLDLSGADTSTVTPLLATSQAGGVLTGPFPWDPSFDWASVASDLRPRPVGAAVLPRGVTNPDGAGGRIVLIGDADFLTNRFLAASPDNVAFARNAVDWLANDESLIGIRAKQRLPPPLLYASNAARDGARYACLVGVPLLFVLIGFLRLLRRRRLAGAVWSPIAVDHDVS